MKKNNKKDAEQVKFPFDGSIHPILERANAIYLALKTGAIVVEYDEANNVWCCTAPDGRTFYKIVDLDSAKNSNYFGSCTVHAAGDSFECPWGYEPEVTSKFLDDLQDASDDLSDLDIDADEVSEIIIDALCDAPGVLVGEYTDFDGQVEAAIACGCDPDAEFYWCEDTECPMERDNLMLIEEHNNGQVEYEGETYYLYEDPDWESSTVHAVSATTTPADDGSYEAVLLHIQQGTDESVHVISIEDSDDIYVAW